jgi:hypothetical protein
MERLRSSEQIAKTAGRIPPGQLETHQAKTAAQDELMRARYEVTIAKHDVAEARSSRRTWKPIPRSCGSADHMGVKTPVPYPAEGPKPQIPKPNPHWVGRRAVPSAGSGQHMYVHPCR